MKPEDFEERLQRQPLRQVPTDWRGEILSAAREAQPSRQPPLVPRHSFLSTLNAWLATILWPHPRAWAGLAAIWILIFAVDFSDRHPAPIAAGKAGPPSPAVEAQLRLQHRMLVELMGASQAREAEPPRLLPSPRSERTEILMT